MKDKQLFTKSKKIFGFKDAFAVLFVLTQLALAPFVHLTYGRNNLFISFITVANCLLFAVFMIRGSGGKKRLIAVALSFTLAADFGLVLLLAKDAILSMYLFNLAQICYFLYLYSEQGSFRARTIHLVLRALLISCALAAVFIALGSDADELSIISLIYYANLLCNTAIAFSLFKKMPLFAIGLLLFVFCDLFVGFMNLGFYFEIERGSFLYSLMYPEINMSWVFYLPSQTLIALNTAELGAKKERGC